MAERATGPDAGRRRPTLPGWLGTPRARYLLLGDWNPIIRDPIDVLRAALLVGAALLIILDKNVEAAPLVTVLIVLIPRLADMPRLFDLAVVVAMSIQAWGNLFDFFDRIHGYDKVVHFLLPMLTSAATYVLLVRLDVVLDPARRVLARQELGTFLITFLIGLGYASLYELYEFLADSAFDAGLQKSLGDTNGDILAGAVGAACERRADAALDPPGLDRDPPIVARCDRSDLADHRAGRQRARARAGDGSARAIASPA